MKKLVLVVMSLLIAGPAMAVELHLATDAQILAELQYRLSQGGGGNQTFAVQAACNSNDLDIRIMDADFQTVATLGDYYGSAARCQRALAALPFGSNDRITAGTQFGYCDHADLEVYGVKPDGTLKLVSDQYQGSQDKCVAAMEAFNGH